MRSLVTWLRTIIGLIGFLFAGLAQAQTFDASTVAIKVGYGAGGGYDTSSRLIERYLGRFLPGNPNIVVQNVPGGGSLKLTKMMLGSEPADGSVLASVSSAMAFAPQLDPGSADFDASSIVWIGSLARETAVCEVTKSSGIDSLEKFASGDFLIGSTGRSSLTYLLAAVAKNGLHAKFKIVTGFEGSRDVTLAMQRGEIAGQCGIAYSSLASSGMLNDVNIVGRFNEASIPGNKEVPNIPGLIDDPIVRQAAELLASSFDFHLPLIAPPGTPKETVDALRKAYAEMTADPQFVAEAKSTNDLEVKPRTGKEIEALVKEKLASDPRVFEAARELVK